MGFASRSAKNADLVGPNGPKVFARAIEVAHLRGTPSALPLYLDRNGEITTHRQSLS